INCAAQMKPCGRKKATIASFATPSTFTTSFNTSVAIQKWRESTNQSGLGGLIQRGQESAGILRNEFVGRTFLSVPAAGRAGMSVPAAGRTGMSVPAAGRTGMSVLLSESMRGAGLHDGQPQLVDVELLRFRLHFL